jgi:hypothetical protein
MDKILPNLTDFFRALDGIFESAGSKAILLILFVFFLGSFFGSCISELRKDKERYDDYLEEEEGLRDDQVW